MYVNDTTTDLTQVVAETDDNGNVTAYYTRSDELLSMEKAGEICYYLYDGHGNVRTLTNEAGRKNILTHILSRSCKMRNVYSSTLL